MKIKEFAKQNGLSLVTYETGRSSEKSKRFCSVFRDCGDLIFGEGPTEEEAIADYASKISGETILMFDGVDDYIEIKVGQL